ncbi:alpha/beta hydrolase [bacterium (Candidatus Blackallbacteria) CG17_big_fil_post_rev_8_21_14_2_50_48_46]|uniref:Alpha/beta hydrolase n=1 Tax=bacterium (Candidatus Blackallbacteria) CG17_big_fil_post_rev_8_21_14_2_50_48_46 TaxID=2014261 RepID=A0A2M7G077_9BACT|nr:MAG: hydrolase [bacterium (Candidatus Blackallbacteria) CG18_big_fil_WC_8_21_14_2_50_49_26]PIW14837.1 MAG: alpha/beta hydrolase [bacterium (Candidatus Blackallbacteria) CG17_big_fil_post_rev_8_21_14_2_50_48_46]PIW44404.1 MAG: alpha/beta hydrolase [bacterium (Candidatus Blackallbacteria) CG13_big_fil_rev_8_21_14_2_50_49_14]
MKRLINAALGLFTTGLCLSWPTAAKATEIQADLNYLRSHLPLLNFQSNDFSAAYFRYLNYYRLPAPQARQAGYVPVKKGNFSEKIFVQYFQPEHPRGTIFLTHGYFVHAGIQHYAVKNFIDQGFSVLTIDLPGHGLSTGAQADIQDFSSYADCFEGVFEYSRSYLPKPFIAVGHSTGGAGIWEFLLRHPEAPFKGVVLAAPLVRSYLWDLSLAGFTVGQSFLNDVPRIVRSTTSDPEFIPFVEKDPLQYFATPLNWVRSLIRWNEQVVESYPPSQIPTLILQGDLDEVVDRDYNLPFLKRKFPRAKIQIIRGASHDLFWENATLRQEVFARIKIFFQSLAL